MPAVATDWVVDAASDIKRFREKPYLKVARVRLASGAGTYASGPDLGIPLPPAGRLGLRSAAQYVNVLTHMAAATGANPFTWQYHPGLRALQAFRLSPTASLATAQFFTEVVSGTVIAGTVLYLEVHGF